MGSNPPFDYRSRAATAREAQRVYDHFLDSAYEKLRTERNLSALAELRDLRNSLVYRDLFDASQAALDAVVPPYFDHYYAKLSEHVDINALEMAIEVLQADPYYFRSGYLKEKMLRYIRGYSLTSEHISKLLNIILSVVDRHYCREFGEYRKLSRLLDSEVLRMELQHRTISDDPNIRNRSQWILNWLQSIQHE